MSNLIYLKIDTTGTDPSTDRILLISALKVTDYGRTKFHRYIRPDGEWHIPKEVTEINGITEEYIKENGEDQKTTLVEFNNFVNAEKGNDLVTFNGLNFDIRFLGIEASRCGIKLDLEFHRMFDMHEIEARNNSNDFANTYLRHVGIDKETVSGRKPEKSVENLEKLFWRMSRDYTREQMLGNFSPTIYDLYNLYRKDKEGNLVFVRGKHSGEKVYDIIRSDPEYITFIFKNIISDHSKRIIINDYEMRKKMVETEPVK